jgi:hypothetical protein
MDASWSWLFAHLLEEDGLGLAGDGGNALQNLDAANGAGETGAAGVRGACRHGGGVRPSQSEMSHLELARLSTMVTCHPACTRRVTVCDPMKPVPPVTRTDFWLSAIASYG